MFPGAQVCRNRKSPASTSRGKRSGRTNSGCMRVYLCLIKRGSSPLTQGGWKPERGVNNCSLKTTFTQINSGANEAATWTRSANRRLRVCFDVNSLLSGHGWRAGRRVSPFSLHIGSGSELLPGAPLLSSVIRTQTRRRFATQTSFCRRVLGKQLFAQVRKLSQQTQREAVGV